MSDLVDRARQYAIHAHGRVDQRRRYTNQPYDAHLKAVADIVADVTDDEEMLAAAWLHDAIEDTPATYEELEAEFGGAVAHLVVELSDVSRPTDGNRAVRKAIDREHLAHASTRAKTIKLADLIDNTQDIVNHDAKFGKVFVTEAAALLEVLADGDPRLLSRARKVVTRAADRLGLPAPRQSALEIDDDFETIDGGLFASKHRALHMFTDTFKASHLADPLRSFDSSRDPVEIDRLLRQFDLPVAGIRIDGQVMGYVRRDKLEKDAETGSLRAFGPDQVLHGDDSLSDVILVLNRYDHCFVALLGDVVGFISRAHMQRPIVRMWLFGIVTLTELELTERIRAAWPDGGWKSVVSDGRLKKAEALMASRQKKGIETDLVDCLQLSDKAQILIEDEDTLAKFGFKTKRSAKRVIKELESLRNHLAHAQDIVTHDWAQIVRMVHRIEEIAGGLD
jgi:hypothetical protein